MIGKGFLALVVAFVMTVAGAGGPPLAVGVF